MPRILSFTNRIKLYNNLFQYFRNFYTILNLEQELSDLKVNEYLFRWQEAIWNQKICFWPKLYEDDQLAIDHLHIIDQLTFTCLKTIETLEKAVWNMFKVNNKNTRTTSLIDVTRSVIPCMSWIQVLLCLLKSTGSLLFLILSSADSR